MKLTPNPEYEKAQFEGACLDEHGNKMSDMMACLAFGRPRPPRYKQLPDGTFEEVFAYLITESDLLSMPRRELKELLVSLKIKGWGDSSKSAIVREIMRRMELRSSFRKACEE